MVLDVTLIAITLIALLIASYSDIRTREVPDWLNYGLIFAAFGIRIIFSFELGWTVLFSGILGFIICLALAFLFYYTGQWGGGDSKLLMAMGVIIGINYPFNPDSWNLLFFFLALLFLGAIYGLIYMIVIAIIKRKLFVKDIMKRMKKQKKLHSFALIVSLIFVVLTIFQSFFWPLIILPLGMFYLFNFVNSVEKTCFFKKIKPENLTEGDWLAEDVKVGTKIIVSAKTLEKEDLVKLLPLKNLILIKEGVPFVPSFLFAYLVLIFGREVFDFIIKRLF
jgi:Flp pilus assembly protein protease CpaA